MRCSWKNPLNPLAVLLLLAAYAGAAFGAAGNVQFVIGDAKLITRAGETRALQKGAEINEGDRIVTAAGASAQIKMADGGFIAVRPSTDMSFDTYRYSGKEDGTESAVVSLLQGGFRTITGLIGRTNKQNYLVRTATATIGIRGTDHEPMVILAPLPGQVAIAEPGTYDKVNVGIAFIRTDAGSIDIHRNQVGFAPVSKAAPVILPRIPPFYKPTPAPGPQKAAAPADQSAEAPAPIRDTAIVDPTSTVSAGAATTVTAVAPAAFAPVVPITLTDASGTTLNLTTQTETTPSGVTTAITPAPVTPPPPISEGGVAAQAQAAAAAALAAANTAQTASTAAAQANATLAGIAQVSTAPASTAITAANGAISTASPSVTSATALTPANAATATANAAVAQTAASTAASRASAAASAFTANGAFADVTAAPANSATQSANSAIVAANASVQTAAATTLPAQNTALTGAQTAATGALNSASTNVTAANGSLITATSQNTAIVSAQSAATGLATQAQAAVTAAQAAATAAKAAAIQAATLQAAGDFTGAAAQLATAQQQQTIAQQQQAIAQNANTALASQLAAAQAAQTAASTAVTNATTTANNAATLAATANTQASAAQTAATNAAATLAQTVATTTATQANIVQTQASIVAAQAPIAAFNNPAVAGNFIAATMFPVAATGGFNQGFSPDSPLRANTTYVLDGGGNLVEARNLPFQVQANQNGIVLTPSITGASGADIKWSGGTAADTLKLPDNSIYGGRWVGSTITVTDNAAPTSVSTFAPANSLWAVLLPPPAGFVQTLVGTTNYTMAGHTTPFDAFGNLGTLNSASLAANFTTQTVDAAVNLTMSAGPMAGTFGVNANAMPIKALSSVNPSGFGVPNANPLTASCTAGACAAGAAGYSADIGGSFAGTGAASAGLSYNIWPTTTTTAPATDSVQGLVAFTAATPPTVLTGVPSAAYNPNNIAIEFATPFFFDSQNSLVAPADLVFVGAGLSSFIDRDIGGSGSISFSVIGGITPVTANANSFDTAAATGVQFGRWTSATALQTSFTNPLGAQSGAPTNWIYGPQGYLDTPVVFGENTGPLTGNFNYALDGSTAPFDRQSGTRGTLTSASVSANFTNQTASASLALTVGGQAWAAATTTPVPFGSSNQFFASSFPGGGASNNLTVSTGAGTPAACPTCFGNLAGAFTGQNYAGAILSYELFDNSNAGGDIVGHAALARTGPAVTNGTPRATVPFFVADSGGNIQPVDTLSTTGGVLTSYGSGSAALPANFFSSTTVTCTICTVTAATNATTTAAPTGVFFGTWDAGSLTNTFGEPLFGGSPHWITGPEAGPLFLANALIGTKSFAFDGGMVTNNAGVTGTVQGTTALTVDFTKQVAGINIDLLINDTAATPTSHAWNARTLPGNEAVLNSGKGLGGAAFNASSFNGTGPGLLTVTVDSTTPGTGIVSGQLTGTGLNGAIMSYDLFATLGGTTAPTFEQVNGVAAFLGSTSDVATPHQFVMFSAADPFSIINQPALGLYANNPTRMLTDAAGNLTRFDTSLINDRGNNNGNGASKTLSSGTSLLSDQGSDPVSGIRWGRWAGGSINITNRIDGTIQTQPLAGSLHWIAGPTETAAVTLPLSGTFTYVNAGGTAPTDNRGNVGRLDSATLTANFTAQTVDVGVQTTIAGASLGGSASAVPIIQRTAFAAGPNMPVNLSVNCTGLCGTTNRGTIVGGFTGAGAIGAAMMYSLEKVGGVNASITSGVVGFHR